MNHARSTIAPILTSGCGSRLLKNTQGCGNEADLTKFDWGRLRPYLVKGGGQRKGRAPA